MSTFSGFLLKNQLDTGSLIWKELGEKQVSSWSMPREAGLLAVGSVSAQTPHDVGHSLGTPTTLFQLLTHVIDSWVQ